MQTSQGLDALEIEFDDDHLVADAGLIQTATLAQHLGLRDLFDSHLDLGDAAGHANVGDKAMTIIGSVLADGDSIDDCDTLRAGDTQAVLGHTVLAPSTIGTFMRSCTWGHGKQVDQVALEVLKRAWSAGAGPGADPVTLDLDSSIHETYGTKKQGGNRFTYMKGVRGYHPLYAHVAGTGDVVHCRQRGGNANTARGAGRFVTEAINRVRYAGGTGPITLRADSGFYNKKVTAACDKAGVTYSITAKRNTAIRRAIETIDDDQWEPIPYWIDDGADVAETTYQPFGNKTPVRLIVRRVRPTTGSQLSLFTEWSYHPIITNRHGDTVSLEADHRQHAVIEDTIRDLKYGVGLNHFPSGKFGANTLWLGLNVIAHNLARWTTRLGLGETLIETATLRRRYLRVPGRITRSGRKQTLHLPQHWPRADRFIDSLANLRTIVLTC